MAGVKGKSGGKRAGAGRKPGPPKPTTPEHPANAGDRDMLKILQDVALGRLMATPLQVRAAIAAVQYTHTKKHDGGKKDEQADKARTVAAKFKPTTAPLKLVGRG